MGSATSRPAVKPAFGDEEKLCYKEQSLPNQLSALSISSPTSADGSLSLSSVASWEESTSKDPKLQLARTILSHSDIRSALTSRSARTVDKHVFNTQVEFKSGPITDQKSSGRCWLFATTNVLRYDIMKKLKLKEFQLSQVNASSHAVLWHTLLWSSKFAWPCID
jgi:bleomycin hydrolase